MGNKLDICLFQLFLKNGMVADPSDLRQDIVGSENYQAHRYYPIKAQEPYPLVLCTTCHDIILFLTKKIHILLYIIEYGRPLQSYHYRVII
jgi:hypothetical protein